MWHFHVRLSIWKSFFSKDSIKDFHDLACIRMQGGPGKRKKMRHVIAQKASRDSMVNVPLQAQSKQQARRGYGGTPAVRPPHNVL